MEGMTGWIKADNHGYSLGILPPQGPLVRSTLVLIVIVSLRERERVHAMCFLLFAELTLMHISTAAHT